MDDEDRDRFKGDGDLEAMNRRLADAVRFVTSDVKDERLREDFARVAHAQAAPELPRRGTLPVMSPETWEAYKRRCRCGRCELCLHYADIERFPSDVWKKYHPHPDRPEFWSVESALAEWLGIRRDGYGPGSAAGMVEDACDRVLAGRAAHERLQASFGKAERVAEVTRALARAFPPGDDHGLGASGCTRVLLARVIGIEETARGKRGSFRRYVRVEAGQLARALEVTEGAVRSIVKRGMRALRIELAARGLIPEDAVRLRRDVGGDVLLRAVRERRAELGRRR